MFFFFIFFFLFPSLAGIYQHTQYDNRATNVSPRLPAIGCCHPFSSSIATGEAKNSLHILISENKNKR